MANTLSDLMVVKLLALLALVCLTPSPMHATVQRYEIRDTARWDNRDIEAQTWTDTGVLGVLYVNGVYVDTINLAFGLRVVRGGVVFQVVRAERLNSGGQIVDPMWHVYFDGHRAHKLDEVLPEYSWVYSSPAIIDSVVYYWGITVLAQGDWNLSARRYDFRAKQVHVHQLMDWSFETDDTGFLRAPRRDSVVVMFEVGEHRFWFDEALRLRRKQP